MRGKQCGIDYGEIIHRSIPARAGETSGQVECVKTARVYPRPCGGNGKEAIYNLLAEGLSPPVRGKRVFTSLAFIPGGSIPARAGETRIPTRSPAPTRVYPRPCGGNIHSRGDTRRFWGLSPPVRGKQPHLVREAYLPWVYPRPCGGNLLFAVVFVVDEGLSPPVRGKRLRGPLAARRMGSIPARAGETLRQKVINAVI